LLEHGYLIVVVEQEFLAEPSRYPLERMIHNLLLRVPYLTKRISAGADPYTLYFKKGFVFFTVECLN